MRTANFRNTTEYHVNPQRRMNRNVIRADMRGTHLNGDFGAATSGFFDDAVSWLNTQATSSAQKAQAEAELAQAQVANENFKRNLIIAGVVLVALYFFVYKKKRA